MTTKHAPKFGVPQSHWAAALLLAIASTGSCSASAQATTLHAPASSLKPATMPRSGLGANATLAAPAASLTAQTAPATLNARVGASNVVAKNYVLKAQVVPGAALSATQKLATAMAALAEIEKQAKEQQDKQTESVVGSMQKNLNVATGATLSLSNPKSSWGGANLHLGMVNRVNFETGLADFNPGSLVKYGNGMGWPAAYCDFKAPEDGYYMVAFSVDSLPNAPGQLTVTVNMGNGVYKPSDEVKATLNLGASIVTLVSKLGKGEFASPKVTSDQIFGFRSCEISRLK